VEGPCVPSRCFGFRGVTPTGHGPAESSLSRRFRQTQPLTTATWLFLAGSVPFSTENV